MRLRRVAKVFALTCVGASLLILATWLFVFRWSMYVVAGDFRGPVLVVYGDPDGVPSAREGWWTVYRIPSDGILVLADPFEPGLERSQYYLEDENGQRTRLPLYDDDPSKLQVFYTKVGSGNQQVEDTSFPVTYEGFVVGIPSEFRKTWSDAHKDLLGTWARKKLARARTPTAGNRPVDEGR